MSSFNVAKTICGVFNGLRKGSSIIAGGYLRDADLGRKPNDIDLIIEYEDDKDFQVASDFGEAFGYEVTIKGKGYIDREVSCVLALNKKGEVPIDVIFLTVPVLERLAIFPCNLCKIHTDEGGVVIRAEDYVSGIKNKEIIYNEVTAREKYVIKMHEYFPDYSHDMDVEHFANIKDKDVYNKRFGINKRRGYIDFGKVVDMPIFDDARVERFVDIVEEENFVGPAFDEMKARAGVEVVGDFLDEAEMKALGDKYQADVLKRLAKED